MLEIATIFEAFGKAALLALEPLLLEAAKQELILLIGKELSWAKLKLSGREAKLPSLKIGGGKLDCEIAIAILKEDILLAQDTIDALTASLAPTQVA